MTKHENAQKVIEALQKIYDETGLFVQGNEDSNLWITNTLGEDSKAVLIEFDTYTKRYG